MISQNSRQEYLSDEFLDEFDAACINALTVSFLAFKIQSNRILPGFRKIFVCGLRPVRCSIFAKIRGQGLVDSNQRSISYGAKVYH